jgi:peroxiredoxin
MALLIGDKAAAFSLPSASGNVVDVDPAANKATVVVWTCNHCPYALAWHDRIQSVAKEYAERGVAFYQINANDAEKYPDDSFAVMQTRVEAGEFASEYLHDEDQLFSKSWGAKVTPDVFVFNSEGVLSYRGAPDSDFEDESQRAQYLRDALDEIIAGKPVSQPETKVKGCSVKWIINDQPNPYI